MDWANTNDEWLRLLVSEIPATGCPTSTSTIEKSYQLFRQEQSLDKRVLPTVEKISAFASIRFNPTCRAYYDRKRGAGKRHNQALIALAHHRLAVLFAMIRDGSLYNVPELKIA